MLSGDLVSMSPWPPAEVLRFAGCSLRFTSNLGAEKGVTIGWFELKMHQLNLSQTNADCDHENPWVQDRFFNADPANHLQHFPFGFTRFHLLTPAVVVQLVGSGAGLFVGGLLSHFLEFMARFSESAVYSNHEQSFGDSAEICWVVAQKKTVQRSWWMPLLQDTRINSSNRVPEIPLHPWVHSTETMSITGHVQTYRWNYEHILTWWFNSIVFCCHDRLLLFNEQAHVSGPNLFIPFWVPNMVLNWTGSKYQPQGQRLQDGAWCCLIPVEDLEGGIMLIGWWLASKEMNFQCAFIFYFFITINVCCVHCSSKHTHWNQRPVSQWFPLQDGIQTCYSRWAEWRWAGQTPEAKAQTSQSQCPQPWKEASFPCTWPCFKWPSETSSQPD